MDNVAFLAGAYALAFVGIVGYAWSLNRRLRRARAEAEALSEPRSEQR
ncbi:MAG: hypothetical protein HY702_07960 [Gemmatimonadetes bacterium]|nr:hypothetical protein [Gemmatimonadota bacterium]